VELKGLVEMEKGANEDGRLRGLDLLSGVISVCVTAVSGRSRGGAGQPGTWRCRNRVSVGKGSGIGVITTGSAKARGSLCHRLGAVGWGRRSGQSIWKGVRLSDARFRQLYYTRPSVARDGEQEIEGVPRKCDVPSVNRIKVM